MEIPGLNIMSDENWEKQMKKLTERPAKKTRKKTPDEDKDKDYKTNHETHGRPMPVIQRGNGRLAPRTTRALMATAIDRGLEVGCSCRIERRSIEKDGNWGLREVENGIYQHYFIVKIGNHRECFSYNEMFGDDYNKVKVRRKSK